MNRIFLTITLAAASLMASAQVMSLQPQNSPTMGNTESKCEIGLGIAPISGGDDVPAAVSRQLEAKLQNALSRVGVAAGDYDCQFFLAGRFDHEFSQQAAGLGGQVLVKSNLQLAICDGQNQKIFASQTFPLKGVGSTDQQALTRALASFGANNTAFVQFVETAKAKIVDYFDKNYQSYITKAQNALTARNYDESLYWASLIPECCVGYEQASQLMQTAYKDHMNYDSQMLLQKAQGEWAADPTAAGAERAYSYLSQIDPASTAFPAAQALGKKIAATVKSDHDFETRTKYLLEKQMERESMQLAHQRERERIAAARAIGVAWAKNQPKTIINNRTWIRW